MEETKALLLSSCKSVLLSYFYNSNFSPARTSTRTKLPRMRVDSGP